MNNKKISLLVWLAVFAVVMAGANITYVYLSKNNSPQSPLANTDPATSTVMASAPAETEEPQQQKKKTIAPDFIMTDANGKSVKLTEFFGKPVVLNFWASWCPPCKSEMPHFNTVYKETKDSVVFLMVDLTDGQRETVEKGKNYVQSQGYSFPVYFDTQQLGAYNYGISSIPTTILIDKEGYIAGFYQGMIDEKTLRSSIETMK